MIYWIKQERGIRFIDKIFRLETGFFKRTADHLGASPIFAEAGIKLIVNAIGKTFEVGGFKKEAISAYLESAESEYKVKTW